MNVKDPAISLIAHRGWSTLFPENSLAAFAGAIAAGADQIEFDVRYSADGIPVLLHDPVLDRISTLHGPVNSYSIKQLQRITILGPTGISFPGMGIATLEQVLTLFAPWISMNIHIKTLDKGTVALSMIQEASSLHPERYIYIAGDELILERALAICPAVPRCCLVKQHDPAQLIVEALKYKCAGLQFQSKAYNEDLVAEAKAHGLFTNLFYADTPLDAQLAIEAGIENLLTNDVGFLRQHFSSL